MKKIVIFLIIFTAFTMGLSAENGDYSSLRVYLKTNSLTFREGNPCYIYAAVKNVSDSNVAFLVYDKIYSTFQPIVYTLRGQEAQTKVDYRLKGIELKTILNNEAPRTVVLGSNEVFKVRIDLADLYELNPNEKYKVRMLFLPDALKANALRTENTLYLTIEERLEHSNEEFYPDGNNGFKPSEIVRLFLTAEMSSDWNNYVKYIDLENYINDFPKYALSYNSGTDAERRIIMREFVSFLSSRRNDYILDFKIENEVYMNSGEKAYVTVRVRRAGGGKPFVYLYKYELTPYKNYWLVSRVQASVTREVRND